VCYDKYLIWGNYYKELFTPFWDDVDTVKFSYNRIDKFLRRRQKKDIDYSSLYSIIPKSRKKNILIMPPNFSGMLNKQYMPNSKGLINFLINLDDLILNKCNIFIRPKTKKNINEFQPLINNDGVKFILNDNCTTTELLSIADIVISPAGSGIVCECALLRVKVLNYSLMGCVKEFWLKYGSDIYCDSAESLYRKIKAIANNEPLNVNWEYFWSEMVYANSGNTNQIIRNQLDDIII
jgi:hypothetical protein